MSRKKVFLSIFLFVLLIIVSIILPTVWKLDKKISEKAPTPEKSSDSLPEVTKVPLKVTFQDFEELSSFLAAIQITSLQEQFPEYLQQAGYEGSLTITFMPEETYYPDKNTSCFYFQITEKDILAVYYNTPSGAFSFGKNKTVIQSDPISYTKPTDENLPKVTTEDIEEFMEGGYADVPFQVDNAEQKNSEEVQP